MSPFFEGLKLQLSMQIGTNIFKDLFFFYNMLLF
jgi:hypothetical protein